MAHAFSPVVWRPPIVRDPLADKGLRGGVSTRDAERQIYEEHRARRPQAEPSAVARLGFGTAPTLRFGRGGTPSGFVQPAFGQARQRG